MWLLLNGSEQQYSSILRHEVTVLWRWRLVHANSAQKGTKKLTVNLHPAAANANLPSRDLDQCAVTKVCFGSCCATASNGNSKHQTLGRGEGTQNYAPLVQAGHSWLEHL